MLDLQHIAKTAQSKELKAETIYQYALGMMSATTHCWALLRYKKGSNYNFSDDRFSVWGEPIEKNYSQLLNQVMELTSSRELKARCVVANMWIMGNDSYVYGYDKNGVWTSVKNPESNYYKYTKTLTNSYASTDIYNRLLRNCDNFNSYINNN